MGAFIALVAHRDPEWMFRRRNGALTCSVSAVTLLITLSILPVFRAAANSILFNSLAYSLSAACLGGLLVYALGTQKGVLHKFLSAAPLRYLGLISYTFYLYHEAVLLKVGQYAHSRTLIAVTAFSITVLISMLSWHLFEAPILGRSVRKQIADFRSRPGVNFWPVETGLQNLAPTLSINDV
jgi:peptidoglycan/LPS O-acetylase OafA/YrhL